MPLSMASKLGIQFARFAQYAAASGHSVHSTQSLRSVLNNAASGSSNATSTWAQGFSSGGQASSNGTGIGGAKFQAGRGAHSSFQQSGRALTNVNASSSHDGATTIGDEEEDSSLTPALIHAPKHLHRSATLKQRSFLRSSMLRTAFRDPQAQKPLYLSTLPSHDLAFAESIAGFSTLTDSHQGRAQTLDNADVTSRNLSEQPPQRERRRSLGTSTQFRESDDGQLTSALENVSAGTEASNPSQPVDTAAKGGQDLDVPMYRHLMHAKHSKDIDTVQRTVHKFRNMPEKNMSTPAFNAALEALLEIRRPGESIEPITDTYVQMVNSACLPNNRSMSAMVQALCAQDIETYNANGQMSTAEDKKLDERVGHANMRQEDNFGQALSMMNLAHASSQTGFPSVHPYNAVLQSCMVRGDAARACDVLYLLSNNPRAKADASTFQYLIACLARDSRPRERESESDSRVRRMDACKQVFDEFRTLSATSTWATKEFDARVWNSMIRVSFELNEVPTAIALIEEMLKGVQLRAQQSPEAPPKPNEETFTTVINKFIQQNDIESAINWFDRIVATNASPDVNSTEALSMPKVSALDFLVKSINSRLRGTSLHAKSIDELQALLPSVSTASRALENVYDMVEKGRLSWVVRPNIFHSVLSNNIFVADALWQNDQHSTGNDLLDQTLVILQKHFELYGDALEGPLVEEGMNIQLLEQVKYRSDSIWSLIRALHQRSRIYDAANVFTYLSWVLPQNLSFLHQIDTPGFDKETFLAGFRNRTARLLGSSGPNESTESATPDQSINYLIVAAESVLPILQNLQIEASAHRAQVKKLYENARAEVNIRDQAITAQGWSNLSRAVAIQSKLVDKANGLNVLEAMVSDIAGLPENIRHEIDLEVFAKIYIALKGESVVPEIEAINPTFAIPTQTRSPDSEIQSPMTLDSILEGYSTPESSVDLSLQAPDVQVIDKDLGQSLDEQLRSNGRGQPTKQDVDFVFDRMIACIVESGVYPSLQGFRALLNALGRRGEVEKIHIAYMYGCKMVAASAGNLEWQARNLHGLEDAMIAALAHAGDAKAASNHRHKAISAGVVPSANAYAALITVVRDTTDDAQIAEELFDESQRLGVVPNVYLFNVVISKLCRARKIERAMELFNEMRNMQLKASSITYGALINGFTRTGDITSAENLFSDMERDPHFRARAPPFNTMMQFYTYTKPDRAKTLIYYDKLLAFGIEPTDYTYKLLLDAYGNTDPVDITGMERVFSDLIGNAKVPVRSNHWASIITAHGLQCGNIDKAVDIFNSIPQHPSTQRSQSALPDAVVFEALLSVFLHHNRNDLLLAYVDQMREANIHPTAYVANLVMRGLASQQNAGEDRTGLLKARALFEEMDDPPMGVAAAGNHPPNHRNHANQQVSDAHSNIEATSIHIPEAGFGFQDVLREPSTFETMIRIELAHGNTAQAENLVERMQYRGYPPALLAKAHALLVEEKSNDVL